MENQLNIEDSVFDFELAALERQDYLDYIDADMEAFYSIKADLIASEL